jgi:Ca2+-binding EF-hand superfamily protein
MDMDADGYINQNEFVITMEQAGMDYREAEQAWSLLSSNGERERIGYSEFIAASVD